MYKIPDQVKVVTLLLALYCWPYVPPFTFGRYDLLLYIASQYTFAELCGRITRDKWVSAIITIEAICAMWNFLYFVFWHKTSLVFDIGYNYFMALAFALELLIITISTRTENGRFARPNSSSPGIHLMCRVNHPNGVSGSQGVHQ